MANHETVSCPRCSKPFECRVGSIHNCQCQQVQLSDEERTYIAGQYAGCLCAACMEEMKAVYKQEKFKLRL